MIGFALRISARMSPKQIVNATTSWMNMQELAVLRHLGKCFGTTEDLVTVFTL